MRAVYYLICWLLTIIIGAVIALFIVPDVQWILLCTFIAFASSTPFIIVFCILMHRKLKKSISPRRVHGITFWYHFFGMILTVGLIRMVIKEEDLSRAFLAIVLYYFIIESILFHSAISIFHRRKKRNVSEPEILDQEP